MEFEEWNKYNLGYTGQQAFEAGQQSQQVKIDEIRKLRSLDEIAINQLAQANQVWQTKVDELQLELSTTNQVLHNVIDIERAKISELQDRIDATKMCIELNKKTIALGYSGYTTEEYVDADDLLEILKGKEG